MDLVTSLRYGPCCWKHNREAPRERESLSARNQSRQPFGFVFGFTLVVTVVTAVDFGPFVTIVFVDDDAW